METIKDIIYFHKKIVLFHCPLRFDLKIESEGPAEKAGEKIDEAVEETAEKVEEAGDTIEEKAEEVEEKAEEATK